MQIWRTIWCLCPYWNLKMYFEQPVIINNHFMITFLILHIKNLKVFSINIPLGHRHQVALWDNVIKGGI